MIHWGMRNWDGRLPGAAVDPPLLPAGFDIAYSLAPIFLIALIVVSLISIARHGDGLSSVATAVWSALVVLAPFLGPIAWFIVGRRAARNGRLPGPARI